jgi:ABC-type transporter Mla subunit MlaD
MVAVPISRPFPASTPSAVPEAQDDMMHWVTAGALVAGGVLLATGNRKAGLAVAAAGTALALLDEQEAIKGWWERLPGYLTQAQDFLDKVEHYLGEASAQGQRLQSMIRR